MQINYQKSAGRKGFSPVQQSRANIQQILNRSAQEQKFIELASKSDLAERERQQAAKNDAFEVEQKQDKRDYEITQDNIAREEQSRQASAQAQAAAQEKMFGSLASLSANAAKAYQEYSTKQEEYQVQADLNEFRTNPEYRKRVLAASEQWQNEQAQQSSAVLTGLAIAKESGEDPYEVAKFGQAAVPLTLGQQMAVVEEKMAGYPVFLETGSVMINGQEVSAAEAKAQGMEAYVAWQNQASYQYLKNQGLTGYSREALAPVMKSMMQFEQRSLTAAAADFVEKQEELRVGQGEEALNRLYNLNSSGMSSEQIQREASTIVSGAMNLFTSGGESQKEASDRIYLMLETLDATGQDYLLPEGSAVRQSVLNLTDGRTGITFGSNVVRRVEARRKLLAGQRKADREYREDQRNEVDDFIRNALDGELGDRLRAAQESGDALQVQTIVEEIKADATEFSSYALTSSLFNSLDKLDDVANENDRKRVVEAYSAGEILDEKELRQTIEDPTVLKEALELARKQKEERYGPAYKQLLEDIPTRARELTNFSGNASGSGVQNPFQATVERDMKAQIELQFQKQLKLNKGDTTAAGQAVNTWFNDQLNRSKANDPEARYYRKAPGSVLEGFPNIGVGGSGARSVAEARAAVAPGAGRTLEGTLDKPQALFTQSQLRDTVSRYNAMDGSYFVPPTARAAQLQAQANGKKVSIEDIINRQVDAMNREQSAFSKNYTPIPNLVVPAAARDMNNVRDESRDILNNTSSLSPVRALRASADPALRGDQVLRTSVRPGMPFYVTGGATNGGWSEHTDIKQMDTPGTPQDEWGTRYNENALDNFVSFTDPEFGDITLSELRRRIPIPGGNFGDPRSYGGHAGLDYGTKSGTKLYLKNGAKKLYDEEVPGNGTRTVIELPDGRRFGFLHGKGVK